MPVEIVQGNTNIGLDNKNFFDFLYTMQLNGMLERKSKHGSILFADDQYVNHQAFRMNLKELGLEKKIITHYDGEVVVEYFDYILDDIDVADLNSDGTPLQPVSLLMLDINMPILNGLETLKIVKEKFEKINEKLNRRIAIDMPSDEDAPLPDPPRMKVLRPMICYLS